MARARKRTATVTATDGHPFWVPELGEWIDATDLQTGQWLQTSAGTHIQITAIKRWTAQTTVYNLTVSDKHTYYALAGKTPVLVHNANCIVTTKQFEHSWDQHGYGGAYYREGKMENVLAKDIDKVRFREMIDETIKNGVDVPRAKSDRRGGYCIDHNFGNVEVGALGQNGMRVVVDDAGNFVTAMPKFMQ